MELKVLDGLISYF